MTLPFFSAFLEVFDIALAIVAALRVIPGVGFQGHPVSGFQDKRFLNCLIVKKSRLTYPVFH